MTKRQQIMLAILKTKIRLASFVSIKWGAEVAFNMFSTPYRKSEKPKPAIFKKAENFSINVNGENINGYRWNIIAKKQLLILHGFESRAYKFDMYISPMLEEGWGVVIMDAKAHGKSEGNRIILPDYVSMIQHLENDFGKFSAYLAHSFGGIAVSLHLEKTKNADARLVLIAPATETNTAINLFSKIVDLKKEVRIALDELILEKSGNPTSFYSVRRIVPKLENKIFWVHDKNDKITPFSDAEPVMNERFSHIEFLITEGFGHSRIYKEKEVIANVIGFLTGDQS
jgi:predicted alpha/beta hydrolase family esterase